MQEQVCQPGSSCLKHDSPCVTPVPKINASQLAENSCAVQRTLDTAPTKVEDLPHWNYDGSSTMQAPGHDSEVYIIPRAFYKDPFRLGHNIIVLCDTYEPPKVRLD